MSPIRVVLLNGTSIYFSLNPSTQKAFKKTFSLPKAFLKLKKDSDSICKTLIKNYEMINITFFFKRENCGEKKKIIKTLAYPSNAPTLILGMHYLRVYVHTHAYMNLTDSRLI